MAGSFIATQKIVIDAPASEVWKALTTPAIVKQYMFGADVVSDWKKGSSLVYRGEWQGQPFEDKGTILEIEPHERLIATYYSAQSGLPDAPESYSKVTYQLTALAAGQVELAVTQDNNPTQAVADKAEENWSLVLTAIKELVEKAD